jgi:hypothetical protein
MNDLHRANLGRAGDRAGRQARTQRVEAVFSFGKLAGNVAGDVHHVTIALDDHDVG